MRILPTEDNTVNRAVALRVLEKRGHRVTTAGSGREALDALQKEPFDLVLMDLQTPEMDGFEATAAMRRDEEKTGGHIPIIALTASAMKGDRERCLEAGMDSYVSKPIRARRLYEVVEGFLSRAGESESGEDDRSPPTEPMIFDSTATLSWVDGDAELLREVIDLFISEAPEMLSNIRESIARSDAQALERAAHKLKGSVGNFRATGAMDASEVLEVMGRDGDLASADEAYDRLESEISLLERALAPHARLGER